MFILKSFVVSLQTSDHTECQNDPYTLWLTTCKCVHLVMRGYIRSRDKDGSQTGFWCWRPYNKRFSYVSE